MIVKTPMWAPWPDSGVQIASGDRTLLNIVSIAHYLPRRGKKKTTHCKHDLNQERIHWWLKYYKKNRKNK